MATNQSELAIHVTDKEGAAVCVLPGDEIPAGVKVANPYVLGQADEGDGGEGPPPQAGPGSGKDKWVAYAEENGVDPEGLDKAEIIAELEGAGVRVE